MKIIIGLLLIVSSGREYVSASRQLGSLFSPGIIIGILAMLFLATWLIIYWQLLNQTLWNLR